MYGIHFQFCVFFTDDFFKLNGSQKIELTIQRIRTNAEILKVIEKESAT
jgi:hypothetical protein